MKKENKTSVVPLIRTTCSYLLHVLPTGTCGWSGMKVCKREKSEREKDGVNERKYFYTNKVVAQSLRGLPACCHLKGSGAADRCRAAGSCLLHHFTAGIH